jgi:predicted exporter
MQLVATCYRFFQGRRGWLALVLLLLSGLCCWQLSRLRLEENIAALLPDGRSQVARDFQLLQQAPFARKLVIQLTAAPGVDVPRLFAATDRLREALPPALFVNPLSGPEKSLNLAVLDRLGSFLPLLADQDDLLRIGEQLSPERIDQSLAAALAQLLQPQGVAFKDQLRRDPLGLERLALQKLRYLNPIPTARLEEGRFLSPDRRSSLILADTPVPITDAAGSRRLLNAFAAAKAGLPEGISAVLLSGHPYTLANAEAIRADLALVLVASGLGLLLLYLIFLRSWRALFVFLLPLFSFAAALLAVSLAVERVSGITLGFGAVLLGITIDFGLHVYFALRRGAASRDEILRLISRPVLFGALTTLAAFAVLLRSELPGQRQLAVFAMAGIAAAVLLALVFLPHFSGPAAPQGDHFRKQFRRHIYDRMPSLRFGVLLLWLLAMVLGALQLPQLRINGELRRLGYLPETLRQEEEQLRRAWGELRGRALIFAGGAELETALQRNEQVWTVVRREAPREAVVSLAPLLPSAATQRQRLTAWEDFWLERRAEAQDLLQAQGREYGFAGDAFAPFWERVEKPPQRLGLEELRSLGLAELLETLLARDGEGYRLLSLLPDDPNLIERLSGPLSRLEGVTLVSQSRFGEQLSAAIATDFRNFISLAGLAVLALLVALFRRLSDVLLAALPVLSGLLLMYGGMGWLGLEVNLFNVVASILIIGLGVDYGIFMVCHSRQEAELDSARAILVSGLTTLVGFGALVLATHPALHSIGITVLLGIGAAVPTAVLVIPAFRPKRL